MIQTPMVNPQFPERFIRVCEFNESKERKGWEQTVALEPPPGTRNFIRWNHGKLEVGLEKTDSPMTTNTTGMAVVSNPSAVIQGSDGLEDMSVEQLQTIAGTLGIRYDPKETKKTEIILSIRAERKVREDRKSGKAVAK